MNRLKLGKEALYLFFFALAVIGFPFAAPVHAQSVGANHYEYVFPNGAIYVYDMDNGHRLVKTVPVPTSNNLRGAVASAATGMLYLSYGGQGGSQGNGSMLKYNLKTDSVVWNINYSTGVDSMAISSDGAKIYMPVGEGATGVTTWNVLDANSGAVIGSMNGGVSPHNTIVGPNGAHVYMGGRYDNYLYVANAADGSLYSRIGPLNTAIRPFTINGSETLLFTTASDYFGFQTSDIKTGKVLYTTPISGFSPNPSFTNVPDHGISLSPDEKELWIIDYPNSYVHVFDVTGLPGSAPRQIADVKLSTSITDVGWLQHSRDGRFVYVGNNGDVIDTAAKKTIVNLPALQQTRTFNEIDFQNGVPSFSPLSRSGVGYVASGSPSPPPPPPPPPVSGCVDPSPSVLNGLFAAPCPVLSVSSQNVVRSSGTLTITTNSPTTATAVGTTIYVSGASGWTPYTVSCPNPLFAGWCTSVGTLTLSGSSLTALTQGWHWIDEWDWTWNGSCFMGPGSTACNQGQWRLQMVYLQ